MSEDRISDISWLIEKILSSSGPRQDNQEYKLDPPSLTQLIELDLN